MAIPDANPDEADFESQLTRMIGELPPTLLHNLHILLTGCTQGALSLWREPGVDAEVIAEAEALTRLTEERVREMSQLRLPEELGRLLLTAPVRLHAVTALGLALLDTPLITRFERFMEQPERGTSADTWTRIVEASRDIGQKLMLQFEERTPGTLYDVEDVLAERAGDLDEAPRYSGDDLRLRRLQIDGLVARSLADYVPPAADADDDDDADVSSEGVDRFETRPDADDADTDPFFSEPYLQMGFIEPQLAMLQLALRLPLALRLLPEHRFGQAARQLRWLRREKAMQALLTRLEDAKPEESIEFSLAELLSLYQGAQFVALALVAGVMQDLDDFLESRHISFTPEGDAIQQEEPAPETIATAEAAPADEETAPLHLSAFFDAEPDEDGDSPRRAIFDMVEGFVGVVRRALDTDIEDEQSDERNELNAAQTEIDEMTELL